jgi:hypothetical protein
MPEMRLYKLLYDNIACYSLRLRSGISVSVRVLVFSLLMFMLEWKIKFSIGKLVMFKELSPSNCIELFYDNNRYM